MDAFTPMRMYGIIGRLPRKSSFLQKMFVKKRILPNGSRKIAFDKIQAFRGIALWCHPLVAGRPMRDRGFSTVEIEPGYTKPWYDVDPMRVLDRLEGEEFTGPIPVEARRQALITSYLNDCYQAIGTLQEKMTYDMLHTGSVTISGEGIPQAISVSYGRHASLSQTLVGGDRWGQVGVSPIDDMTDWHRAQAARVGAPANRWVFGPNAATEFRKDAKYEKLVDQNYKRQNGGSQLDAIAPLDSVEQGACFGRITSAGGSVELWEYQQSYTDAAGAEQKIMGDNQVLIGYESTDITQHMAYGTVIDPALNYASGDYTDPSTGALLNMAPWHAIKQKPDIGEMVGVYSAPLAVGSQIDATFGATVA